MNILVMIGLILVLLVLMYSKHSVTAAKDKSPKYDYQLREGLLTPAERSFYSVLAKAAGTQYVVMAKVRIADVITPQKGHYSQRDWHIAFNRVAKKHFDFVLCYPDTLQVAKVVELNDKSHRRAATQQRDRLVSKACQSAGLPLITVTARRLYRLEDIKQAIH